MRPCDLCFQDYRGNGSSYDAAGRYASMPQAAAPPPPPPRNRSYGGGGGSGWSDTEDRYYQQQPHLAHSDPAYLGDPHMYGDRRHLLHQPPPPPPSAARPRGGRRDEFDSDIESVVSATSAFSSQSAPHARARRLG